MKIKHLIDILLTPEITALPYVDRYGGIVKTMHLTVDDGTEKGVKKTHIIDAQILHALLLEVYTDKGIGTEIIKNKISPKEE